MMACQNVWPETAWTLIRLGEDINQRDACDSSKALDHLERALERNPDLVSPETTRLLEHLKTHTKLRSNRSGEAQMN